MAGSSHHARIHGVHDAVREWRRIVDLALRHGLGAVPANRPQFAPVPVQSAGVDPSSVRSHPSAQSMTG